VGPPKPWRPPVTRHRATADCKLGIEIPPDTARPLKPCLWEVDYVKGAVCMQPQATVLCLTVVTCSQPPARPTMMGLQRPRYLQL
jgi:hypothetical protein